MYDPAGPTLGFGEEGEPGLELLEGRAGEGGSEGEDGGGGGGGGEGDRAGEGEAEGDPDGWATWLDLGAAHEATSTIRQGRSTTAGRTGASRG
jgi:hypothetical protein